MSLRRILDMPTSPTEGFLNCPLLRRLAGEEAYLAGERCLDDGRVRQIQFGTERVTARVADESTHRVKIWRTRGELQFSCGCPAGRERTFCAHCVAVGLAWVQKAERHGAEESTGTPAAEAEPREDLRAKAPLERHLKSLERGRLVALLLEATDYDDILRRRLLMEAIGVAGRGIRRSNEGPAPDFAAYRQILREAIDAPDYVDYDAMPDYVQGVADAVQPLGEWLHAGHAAVVVELAELALVSLDRASEMIDASDGSLNPIYDDLQNDHLQACRVARPDPQALAARLLDFELEGGLGVFNNAAKTYAEVLGPEGLAAWRRLLVQEWSRLPTLSPTRPDKPAPIDHRRFRIQELMEDLASTEGDPEMLAAVKRRDLSSPHDFLSLAQCHLAAGRPDEALSWAERGLHAFPESADHAGLRDLLQAAYRQAGRHGEASALAWEQFARAPQVDAFLQLKTHASQTSGGWLPWRGRALTLVRDALAARWRAGREPSWPDLPDHSVVVELLLADGDEAAAWQEAQTGGCRPELWRRLAGRREHTHPADALRVYQDQLGPVIAQGGLHAYQEAIDLLKKISALLEGLGRAAEADSYRAEVRATHRQKRRFVKLLDASGR